MTPLLTREGRNQVDPLTWKPLWVCWSLSTSSNPPANLEMSQHSQEVVNHEAILWHARDAQSEKFQRFCRAVAP